MEKEPRKKVRRNKKRSEARHKPKFKNDNYMKEFVMTPFQEEAFDIIADNKITFIDSVAGCGKTALSLFYACKKYLVNPHHKIIVVRSPTEMGKDRIGFLPSDLNTKLLPHFESTKVLLEEFLGAGKVESDLDKRIFFTIPNFALGQTRKDCTYIIDEAQLLEPLILKLLMERIGENTTTIVLGSSGQLYANDKHGRNALRDALERFFDKDGNPLYPNIAKYKFPIDAIMRDDVVKDVIRAYDLGEE